MDLIEKVFNFRRLLPSWDRATSI